MEFLAILDIFTLICGVLDSVILSGLLIDYLSKRNRAVYAINTLIICYALCVLCILTLTLCTGKSFNDVGWQRIFFFPMLYALLIATVITLIRAAIAQKRLRRKKS